MIKAKLVLPDVAAVPSKDQSDWNVNDPEEAGYVKNRTHYKEDAISYIPITESDIITFNDVAGRYVATINNVSLTEGVYKVVIRGQEGLYESTKVGDTCNILVTNPEGISFSYIEGTNFITVVDENATTSYQTSLSLYLQDVDTTYHKLGMEYIPSDEIADEIFPTLGVEAGIASESDDIVTLKRGIVNNDGTIENSDEDDITLAKVAKTGSYNDLTDRPTSVQSDWSTNESEDASYVKNRTHYVTETVIIDSKNLTFTIYGNVSQCVVNNLTLTEGYYKIRIRGVEGVYRCLRDENVYTISIFSNPDNIVFTYNSGDTYTTIVNYTTVNPHTTYLGISSLAIEQLAEYYIPSTVARVSQIPTSNSQLANDEGYITASNNLSDVDDRQTALNNITNATTQSVEKVLSLGDDGNASWKDRFERAAGVTANEVSVHDHRGNFSSDTDVYVPLMSFRHLNSMRKFQIEFSLMAADATVAEYPVYYARYVFFRSTIYDVEGKFMCVDCASTDDTLFSMNDVVAVSSTEGNYTYTTFYKKNAGIDDWNMYCIHSMSTFSYNGQTGYVVPTYYVGSYATDLKSGEVRVTDSMLRQYSDFTTVYPCMDKTVGNAIYTALNTKADKVTDATNGNLAGWDSNGNLTDSRINVGVDDNCVIIDVCRILDMSAVGNNVMINLPTGYCCNATALGSIAALSIETYGYSGTWTANPQIQVSCINFQDDTTVAPSAVTIQKNSYGSLGFVPFAKTYIKIEVVTAGIGDDMFGVITGKIYCHKY